MSVTTLPSPALALVRPDPGPALVRRVDTADPFVDTLDRARGVADTPSPHDEARSAAEKLVATALVQPILARAREASTAVEPFAPGPAERRFGGLLDQHLADRIVRASSFPLVEELTRRLASPDAPRGLPTLRETGVIA